MTDKKVWLITGPDAIALAEQKLASLRTQIAASCDLSTALALEAAWR